ncbi:MAG: acyl-CoA thioesterase [Sedimentisphaerales bacterium]|nr:acyl-CoA thioesterase [Sedimentisphaerales bacterium]
MFRKTIEPRFGETDALGHINNVTMACWFELARNDLQKYLYPNAAIDIEQWSMIMAHSSYDFHAETHYGLDVEVRTTIEKIGNSSFTLYHELWQEGKKTVTGKAVIVHYDFKNRRSIPLTEEIRARLSAHLT